MQCEEKPEGAAGVVSGNNVLPVWGRNILGMLLLEFGIDLPAVWKCIGFS